MKYFSFLIVLVLSVSCVRNDKVQKEFRQNFTKSEKEILAAAEKIMNACEYVSLITIDANGQARARVMETLEPETGFVIWMGTNPRSRKVSQIAANSMVTMHYFNEAKMAYVSLMGKAFIINDTETKSKKWKDGWENFYKNRTDDFMLIKFIPETIEVIGMLDGFSGDAKTWAAHKVIVRE